MYNVTSANKGMAEIIFAKHRMGRLRTFHLKFNGRHSRFENCSTEYIFQPSPIPNKRYQSMSY